MKHLLGIKELSSDAITHLLDISETYIENRKQNLLKERTIILLFVETSTRTRTSFEIAGKRLGANVISISVEHSAIKKGETLVDTAMTLNAMNPDVLVMRHPNSGAAHLLSNYVNHSIINAGDGSHEHPTQALTDALTIRRHFGHIQGLTIAICGDIMHSRVARSNILLLNKLGAHVRIIAPPTLIPSKIEKMGVQIFHDMHKGISDCNVIMMLRLQKERMQGSFVPSMREYFHLFGLNKTKLVNKETLILHPGPINRGVEIDSDIADDVSRSAILDQVKLGVAIRQGCFDWTLNNA